MQLPQLSVPPQASEMMPQSLPSAAHVVAVHAVASQRPFRHDGNPRAAQSTCLKRPSWQNLTVVPSQLARSRELTHSLPVSTHTPASQRRAVPLRAQSSRDGLPSEQRTAVAPSHVAMPPSHESVVSQVAPASGLMTHERPKRAQSPRTNPTPWHSSA